MLGKSFTIGNEKFVLMLSLRSGESVQNCEYFTTLLLQSKLLHMSAHVCQFFAHNPVTRNLNLVLRAFFFNDFCTTRSSYIQLTSFEVRTYHTEAF